jgi:hypothetical protein
MDVPKSVLARLRSMRDPQIRYPTRPVGASPWRPRPSLGLAIGAALALLFLAGCTAGGGDANVSPRASLDVNHDEGWSDEDFVFDASQSTDTDGEIVRYTFDFGDDSPPMEVTDEDMANSVTHRYARGGEYTVTLTVTDDGDENTGALTDTDSTNVAVNERFPVASLAVSAVPADEEGNTQYVPFDVYEKANRYSLNLTLTSLLLTGSSEFEIKVLDTENETLGEAERVTVGPNEEKTVDLDGLLTKVGVHRIQVQAISGGGTATGEMRVYYGEDTVR